MKPKVVSLDYDQLISELKQGSEDGFELLRFAYANKMYDLMFSYFCMEEISKQIVGDVFTKIKEEKNLPKERYDFRNLIAALANKTIGERINTTTQDRTPQVPFLCVSINEDQNERLLDDFQRIIKDAVLQLPVSERDIWLKFSGISDSETALHEELSQTGLKISLNKIGNVIREYLNAHPDFAILFLLMAINEP